MSGIIERLRAQFQSLFLGPVTVPNSGTTLCTTCITLDLKKILRDGLPEAKMISLGTLSDITNKNDCCAFCRLVADLIRRRWRLDDFPDADVQGTNFSVSAHAIGTLIPNLDEKKQAHRLFIHAARPLDITVALMAAKAAPYLDIQLLEEDSRKVPRSKALHGRRVKDNVDIHLIKRWIKLCERAHGDACETVRWKSGDEDLPECVRMVDVIRMALVHAGHNCRYVALSYVWGGPGGDYWTSTANAGARNRPSGLEESVLPATIVDAIQLTRQIGERYLWVDALCIVQDSQADKASQISVMDQVYGRALLTLIAASGASVRAGLPGVRAGSRMLNQHVECVQGFHLSIPLPPLSEAATDSTWNTRGWTFQETALSRRRLYFTKHQIYFECERDVWCEDLVAESESLQGSFNPMRYMGLDPVPLVTYTTVTMNFRAYQTAIALYSQRHLTVDSDIMCAAAGFMNAMTRTLEPPGSNPKEVFQFGMWIRNLDLSLLWQPRFDAIHTRRIPPNVGHSCWPSWAWSGWKGAVQYGNEQQMLDGADADVHEVPAESLVTAWHLVDEDGTIIRLNVKQIPPSWSVDGDTDGCQPPYKYVASQSHPNDLVLGSSPPSGTLVFRTQCARFRVVKPDDDNFIADPRNVHTIFHISPVDQVSAHYAGRIILPTSTPSLSIFEFVVLSRCDGLVGLWDEGKWGKRYYGCLLHVMAVKSIRDNAQVNERVGLGLIVESAWMESKAEERVVLLA
ncbi:heterokaryon incompatibility protein-domain-containing protein [Boletus reticuloceps]|uniref:Heterokaryon incompatibility protein-domain-containing protein n=1 Tax=Boletus reticuloceps TaxID=495285 RepID=A0A8I2YVF2_9AGAM|nr:heterokaryon incompatibility protein-domain-containing protein [Boletus reticuloceps]